jgi:hypothetical protein
VEIISDCLPTPQEILLEGSELLKPLFLDLEHGFIVFWLLSSGAA